jgi:hypothetical protein
VRGESSKHASTATGRMRVRGGEKLADRCRLCRRTFVLEEAGRSCLGPSNVPILVQKLDPSPTHYAAVGMEQLAEPQAVWVHERTVLYYALSAKNRRKQRRTMAQFSVRSVGH